MLDNYTVELGTQDFILLCRIAKRREGEIPLESPLWGKLLPKLHTLYLESQCYQTHFKGLSLPLVAPEVSECFGEVGD
jgi:hypothetical protein